MGRDARTEAIRVAIGCQADTAQVFFRGTKQELPRIQVSIQLPTYRLSNGRTQTAQIARTRPPSTLAPDFFSSGQENESAQSAQHAILTNLSRDPKADIHAELRERKVQTEPLLVTRDGIVVNGNRRLCAMRELWASDPTAFASFERVDVVVLPPDTTSQEVERLETYLQEARPTKLDYDWVNRGLKLRRQLNDYGIVRQQVIADYRFRNDAELNGEIAMIDLVDEYLEHFGAPQQYEMVRGHEQAFKDLRANLESKANKNFAREAKLMAFTLIRNSEAVEGRTYDYRRASGSHLERVLERIAEDRGIDLDAPTALEDDGDDLLAMLNDGATERYAPLREILSAPNATPELAQEIAEHLATILEEDRDGNRQTQAVRSLRSVRSKLNSVNAAAVPEASVDEALGEVRLIVDLAARLQQALEAR